MDKYVIIVREPEELLNRLLKKYISKIDIQTFIFTFLIVILTYIPLITSWLANPDAVWNGLYYKDSYQWEISLGRFGLAIYAKMKSNIISPSITTIISLVFLALIVVIVRKIFEINGFINLILVAAFITLNPAIISTLTYYYCSDAYMLSYLLAVVAAYLLTKENGFVSWLLGTLCLTISLSLYQAYLPVTLVLILFYLIQTVLRNSTKVQCFITLIVRFFLSVGMGVILYIVSLKLAQWFFKSPATSSRGFNHIGEFDIKSIIGLIKNTYSYFTNYLIENSFLNNEWAARKNWNVLCILSIVILFAILIIKSKTYKSRFLILLLTICVTIIPVFVFSISIMAPEVSIYGKTGIIMLPTVSYIYVLMIILVEILPKKQIFNIMQWGIAVLGIIISITSVSFIMVSISYLQWNEKRMYSVATNLVGDIREVSDYSKKLPLMVGGRLEEGNLVLGGNEVKMYEILKGTTASYGSIWPDLNSAQSCWINYFSQYCGINYTQCSKEMSEIIIETDEYKDMPYWPDQNSIKIINEIIVLKLSD